VKTIFSKLLIPVAALAMLAGLPSSAEACTVCFGDPESDVVQGAAWAIIFLGSVVMSVMGCLGGFFVFLARRASSTGLDAAAQPDDQV